MADLLYILNSSHNKLRKLLLPPNSQAQSQARDALVNAAYGVLREQSTRLLALIKGFVEDALESRLEL